MRWLSYLLPGLYLALCGASIVILFISTEPLAALYALFLAWPWSFVLELVGSDQFLVNVALVTVSFLINAAILYAASLLIIAAMCSALARDG